MDKNSTLYWLLDTTEESDDSGRTEAMGRTFIGLALDNPGKRIEVFDHRRDNVEHITQVIHLQLQNLTEEVRSNFKTDLQAGVIWYEEN